MDDDDVFSVDSGYPSDSDIDEDVDGNWSDEELFQPGSVDDDEMDAGEGGPIALPQIADRRVGGVTVRHGRSIAQQSSNDDRWKIEQSTVRGYVKVSHATNSMVRDVTVSNNRLGKFKSKLDVENLLQMMGASSSCVSGCRRQCCGQFTLAEIIQCRLGCFQTATTEQKVTEHLVRQLLDCDPSNRQLAAASRRSAADSDSESNPTPMPIKYAIGGKGTCHVFWAKAYGVSEDKMKKVRAMVRHGSTVAQHGNSSKSYTGTQSGICYAFWHNFFEQNCQRPNDELRLFPVNNSQKFIYDSYFLKWFEKQQQARLERIDQSESEIEDSHRRIPCFSLFKKVRWHPDFKDVKKRARHYHCQCKTCDALNTRRLRGFVNDEHRVVWQTLFDAHEADKLGWRRIEQAREAEVRAAPNNAILLQYDDTSALGFPKMTNRSIKNLTHCRFFVIPFNIMNYASGESAYVYTVKNRYGKGANRLCTVLYHTIRKIKFGDHPCRHARTLYLHADNASENKNNTLLLFLSELVQKGWFDDIFVEFGPPGHTHNGRDAVHHIHNRIAGNFFSATLGDFQSNWVQSWRKAYTMPTAVVADVQYDFDGRYEGCAHIAGFTNTRYDEKAVHAFRVRRSASGPIEVLWKQKASDSRWLGADHQPHSPGFVLLSRTPGRHPPAVIPPIKKIYARSYIASVCGPSVTKVLTDHVGADQAAASIQWLKQSMQTGSMPYDVDPDAQSVTKADWGLPVKLGPPGAQGDFFAIQADADMTDFWDLPTDLNARLMELEQKLQDDRDKITGNPNVRYSYQNPKGARLLQQQAAVGSLAREFDEGGEVEPEARQWGAPVSACLPGVFAVVLIENEDGVRAVDLVKVTSFAAGQKEGEEKFTGELFTPARFCTSEASCLNGKWNPPRAGCDLATNYCYCVLTYFPKLNTGGKLPKKVVDEIWAIALTQQLDLFGCADDDQAEAALSPHMDSEESDSDNNGIGINTTDERKSSKKRLRKNRSD